MILRTLSRFKGKKWGQVLGVYQQLLHSRQKTVSISHIKLTTPKIVQALITVHICNLFMFSISMTGYCHVQPQLIDFNTVALSCLTLYHVTVFTEAQIIRPEGLLALLFQAVLFSLLWVGKLMNKYIFSQCILISICTLSLFLYVVIQFVGLFVSILQLKP